MGVGGSTCKNIQTDNIEAMITGDTKNPGIEIRYCKKLFNKQIVLHIYTKDSFIKEYTHINSLNDKMYVVKFIGDKSDFDKIEGIIEEQTSDYVHQGDPDSYMNIKAYKSIDGIISDLTKIKGQINEIKKPTEIKFTNFGKKRKRTRVHKKGFLADIKYLTSL
jgi:hypothetical protein